MPTKRDCASTTKTEVIPCCSINCAASTGQGFFRNSARVLVHQCTRSGMPQIGAILNTSAQITIRKNTLHAAFGVHHRTRPHILGTDLAHQAIKTIFNPYTRHVIAAAHHVTHMGQQPAAQRATRVRQCKIFCFEPSGIQQRRGQCVTKCQLYCGTGCRRQVQRARFTLHTGVQHPV